MIHWWLSGTHNTTKICWQSHYLFGRSSIAMICLMLISSMIFTFCFLKTLVDLYWMSNGVHMRRKWSVELHFNCHNECAMWISNQVLSQRCSEYCRLCFLLSGPYIIGAGMCLSTLLALCPYVYNGNSWPLDQPPAIEQSLVIFIVDKDHCKAHMSMSVFVCTNQSWDSI